MPTVQKAQRQVAPDALPGVRRTSASSAIAEGAGVAQAKAGQLTALGRIGDEGANVAATIIRREEAENRRVAEEARQRADRLAVIAAETKLADAERAYIYDPEKGVLTRKGKDALSAPDEVEAWYTSTAGDIEKGLTTDAQKAAFAAVKAQRGEQIKMTTARHVGQQIQAYTAAETAASVSNAADLAIANALDPTRAAIELRRGEATIEATSAQLGLTPAQKDQQIQALRGTVHLGVIDRLLANDQTKAASIYFEEANKAGQIPGDKIASVEKALKVGTDRKKAQTETARILAAGGTEAEARAAAKAIEDPEVQDETLRRIEHEFAVKDRQEKDQTEKDLRGVADILDRNPNVSAIPAKVWSELTPAQRSSFRSYAKQITEKGDVETNLPLYYKLSRDAVSADPAVRNAFRDLNLTNHIGALGKTEFKQLTDLQTAIIAGDQKKIAALSDGYLTNQQVVDTAMLGAGMDPTPDPTKEPAKAALIAKFRFEVDRQVGQLGKEKPTNMEIQSIVDGLLVNVVTEKGKASGWGPLPGPYYDVTKRKVELLAEIPARDRAQIEDEIRRLKGRVTNDNILAIWNASRASKKIK